VNVDGIEFVNDDGFAFVMVGNGSGKFMRYF
jgi:hypothetical protein